MLPIAAWAVAAGLIDWPAATALIGMAGVFAQAWIERRGLHRSLRSIHHELDIHGRRLNELTELGRQVGESVDKLTGPR